MLEWREIEARVIDIEMIALGEFSENEFRKDLTLSERDAIRRRVAKEIKAFERRGRPEKSGNKLPDFTGRTSDEAAKRAGFGNRETARQVAKVVDKGIPELGRAMDAGKISVKKAAEIADKPAAEQRKIIVRSSKD